MKVTSAVIPALAGLAIGALSLLAGMPPAKPRARPAHAARPVRSLSRRCRMFQGRA
jgi:hypothetical protein